MKYSLLRLMATSAAFGSFLTAQNPGDAITDPIPEPITTNGVGLRLIPWVDLGTGGDAPRINGLTSPYDGSGRLFAVDQAGLLHVIDASGAASLYLDLRVAAPAFQPFGNQAGFTYLAFHPEFETNGVFFTVSSAATSSGTPDFEAKRPIINSQNQTVQPSHHDVIHRWQATDPSADTYEGNDPVEILRFEQPYGDHNVGMIAFRHGLSADHPDYGLLFIAMANGGSDGWPPRDTDPQDHGQDFTTPYGAHLRIDPSGSDSANGQYGIPTDNPWVGSGTGHLPELWTYGHRNPHRFSWDSHTGTMYSFEIGQAILEEINVIEPGLNYGWGERYGVWAMDQFDQTRVYPLPADDAGFAYPVAQYAHPDLGFSGSAAITDGHVYRGGAMPELWGRLIFGDFVSESRLFYLELADLANPAFGSIPPIHELELHDESGQRRSVSQIVNFGQSGQRTDIRISVDEAGELYVTNKRNGWVYKMASAPDAPTYTISPSMLEIPGEGGQRTLEISLSNDTSTWTATTDDPEWIAFDGATGGTGSASLEITFAPSEAGRRGTIRINGVSVPVVASGSVMDGYFPDAAWDGERQWESDWFGSFRGTLDDLPWIWHTRHGWQWTSPVTPGQTYWFYDLDLGWNYLARESYPWIYYSDNGEWCYYSGYGEGAGRWFWNAARGWFLANTL